MTCFRIRAERTAGEEEILICQRSVTHIPFKSGSSGPASGLFFSPAL